MSVGDLSGGRRARGIGELTPAPHSVNDDAADDGRRPATDDWRQAASLLSAAYRDDVTGALNRRPGREHMQGLLDRARRDGSELTVIFVDVDGLKGVNDTQGHARGDALLAAVGTALRCSLRTYDVVVRYGGDEFVCALPGGTAHAAEESLIRVRSMLNRLVPGATVSAGCATLQPTDTLDDMIDRADTALYDGRRLRRPTAQLSAVPTTPPGAEPSTVACGDCGGRVPLSEFVLELTARMTRAADCPDCGATTLIQLARPSILTPVRGFFAAPYPG